ncbi:MAG: helix-turn-helix domain-containing protein [Dehalococcoidia bacterium]|nr:helix-turn-helix domain-containing protein [Dehalococcoidia bacterium]
MAELRYKKFGQKVREWREALRPTLTQRELADKVGVSYGFIGHIEIGKTLPGRETLKALARALGIPEMQMFREAGYLSDVLPSDDELIDDPELRLFFRDEWKHLSPDEKDWFKGFVRMIKERRKEKDMAEGR